METYGLNQFIMIIQNKINLTLHITFVDVLFIFNLLLKKKLPALSKSYLRAPPSFFGMRTD